MVSVCMARSPAPRAVRFSRLAEPSQMTRSCRDAAVAYHRCIGRSAAEIRGFSRGCAERCGKAVRALGTVGGVLHRNLPARSHWRLPAAMHMTKHSVTRERARRAAAPEGPAGSRPAGRRGSSARRDRSGGAKWQRAGWRRRCVPGLPNGARRRRRTQSRRQGWVPAGHRLAARVVPWQSGDRKGPDGSFDRVRRPTRRRFGRTTTAEAVDRMRNARRALATSSLGRQPAGDGASGPVPGSVWGGR